MTIIFKFLQDDIFDIFDIFDIKKVLTILLFLRAKKSKMPTNKQKRKRKRPKHSIKEYAKQVRMDAVITCGICFDDKLEIQHHQGCSKCTFRICWTCFWKYFKFKNPNSGATGGGGIQINVKEKLFRLPCPGCRQTSLFLDCMQRCVLLYDPSANTTAEALIEFLHHEYCDYILCLNAMEKCFSKRTKRKFKKALGQLTDVFFDEVRKIKIGMTGGKTKCLSDDCNDVFCPQWSRLLDRNLNCMRVTSAGQAYELYKLIWTIAGAYERAEIRMQSLLLAMDGCYQFCEKATRGWSPPHIPYLVTLSYNAYGYETIRQHSASLTKADLDCFATTNVDMHYLHIEIKWHVRAKLLDDERKKSREGFCRHNTVQRQQLHEDLAYHFFS